MAVVAATMADARINLAGFTAILAGPATTRWATSFHNWIKTWYAPLLFRPHLFVRGGRLLFGDHAMFFRRADFGAVGGFDEAMAVMEEADLCVRMARLGRTRLVNRIVITSDRRIAAWGEWRANWIYLKVGFRWGLGIKPKALGHLYPDIR
jgi:GT2 family glycosyltransferase